MLEPIDIHKDYSGQSYSVQLQMMIKECALKMNEIIEYLNKKELNEHGQQDNKSSFPRFR